MKKLFLIFVLIVSFATFAQNGPEFEIYTGLTIPKPEHTNLGYMIGLNVTPDLFQIDKHDPKKYREYLNKWLLGIEFSGYQTRPQTRFIESINSETLKVDCNCTATSINGDYNGNSYVTKQIVNAVSLNVGIEIYKGWYLLSGISSYQHKNKVNNEILNKYRTTYIDGGIKKFIKIGKAYWSPTFKFNSEVISFGVGYSYYK